MSLPNPNKTVTEARLSEFYTQILPYLGGMPEAICNKFDKANLYSTIEKVVGCNTDGKPVYQKTIECGNLPNATTKNVAHNISNIDAVVGIKGTIRDSSTHRSTPIDAVGQDNWSVSVSADRTNIIILTWQNYSTLTNFSLYATIQYTKTTDAANSFKWGDENDLSTTEKIVGIDNNGDYIYQKTFTDTVTITANTEFATVIATGIKHTYKAFGYVTFSNNYELTIGGDTSANYSQFMKAPTGDLYLTIKSGSGGSTKYNVTLQYTKTS